MYYLIQCQWNQLHMATLHRFEGGKQHVGKLSQHYCWCTLPTAKIPISFPRLGVPGTGHVPDTSHSPLSHSHKMYIPPLSEMQNVVSAAWGRDNHQRWCILVYPSEQPCSHLMHWEWVSALPGVNFCSQLPEENHAFPLLCKYVLSFKSCSIFLPSTIFSKLVTTTVLFK